MPLVVAGIRKVESVLHLLKADAMTAAVIVGLRMVGVLDVDSYMSIFDSNAYVYETGFRWADAMLESVLYEGYGYQG